MFESPNCSPLSLEDSCLGTPRDQSPEPDEPHAPSTRPPYPATLILTSRAYVTAVVETFQIPDCCFTQPCPSLNSFFLFLVVVVFLSLQIDRELGIAAKECACSPLQLFWGCNPSGLGPDPPPFLYPLALCMFHREVYQRFCCCFCMNQQCTGRSFLKGPTPCLNPPPPSSFSTRSTPFCWFSLSPPQPLFLIGLRSQSKLATRAN